MERTKVGVVCQARPCAATNPRTLHCWWSRTDPENPARSRGSITVGEAVMNVLLDLQNMPELPKRAQETAQKHVRLQPPRPSLHGQTQVSEKNSVMSVPLAVLDRSRNDLAAKANRPSCSEHDGRQEKLVNVMTGSPSMYLRHQRSRSTGP